MAEVVSHAEYVAILERVASLAARLMQVAYDDGPEEIALCTALDELEWDTDAEGNKIPEPPCDLAQSDGTTAAD